MPQKNTASASFNSLVVNCFSSTGISSSLQISRTVALVIPDKIFPNEGVNNFPSFSKKIFAPGPSATKSFRSNNNASSKPSAFASWLARIEFT